MNPTNPINSTNPKPFTPFGGIDTQLPDMESARVVVLPLCYENAVSYGTGCGNGPLDILAASRQIERLDEETFLNWGLRGIFTLPPLYPSLNAERAVGEMKAVADRVIRKEKFLLSLGGDHAVSIGPIMAAADAYPEIGVLQVDAHLDMRDEWNGSRFNHACVMRRVVEDLGLTAVQVGIRSFSAEEADFVRGTSAMPFYAHQLSPYDDAWVDHAIEALPETVYLTVDVDGLDPSVIPGTGTPEPGGLSYRQLLCLVRALGRRRHVVAADITEISAIEGSRVSEYTAAKIATKIICHCVS